MKLLIISMLLLLSLCDKHNEIHKCIDNVVNVDIMKPITECFNVKWSDKCYRDIVVLTKDVGEVVKMIIDKQYTQLLPKMLMLYNDCLNVIRECKTSS